LDDIQALPMPHLDTPTLLDQVGTIKPLGLDRGLARWRERLPGLVWNDASLEGNPVTLPEVVTLLDAGSIRGHKESDTTQILDLSRAAELVEQTALTGFIQVSDQLSSTLNALIAAHEIIEPGVVRGEGLVQGETVVAVMGVYFVATPGGPDLRRAFTQSMDLVNSLPHPLAQATGWAALAAYHQFYANGNKRTARYLMNTILLSHGFDAIVTPAALREPYNQALKTMYVTGDATGYAQFLAGLYDDGHVTG
jgi:hypothetical protein